MQAHSQGISVPELIIMAKAIEMNKKLDKGPSFKGSLRQLDKFKG